MSNLSLTRDDHFVAVQRSDQNNIDLWYLDLTREGDFVKLTVDPGIDAMPQWSPDRKQIAFNKIVNNVSVIAIKRVDGSAPEEGLPLPATGARVICDWSADGRYILYKQFDEESSTTDLWAVPLQGNRNAVSCSAGSVR